MPAEVDIWNLALSRINARATVAAPDEQSDEAHYCRLFYDQVRDQTLQADDWNFARYRADLALLGNCAVTDRFTYRYALPPDCLAVRVLNDRRVNKYAPAHLRPKFEIAGELDDSGAPRRVLMTDESPARIIYSSQVTQAGIFDPLFVAALSWALAAEIALPITGKQDMMVRCAQGWNGALAAARAANAIEGIDQDDAPPDWLSVRAGWASPDTIGPLSKLAF